MPAKNPPYRILPGSPWPGLGKLIEEAAELIAEAARLIGAVGSAPHLAEVALRARLEDEIADVLAAAEFVAVANGLDERRIAARKAAKLALFNGWHRNS